MGKSSKFAKKKLNRKSHKKSLRKRNTHRRKGSKKLTRKNRRRNIVRKGSKYQRGGFLDALIPQDITNLGRHFENNSKNFYNDVIGQTHNVSPSVMTQPINQKNFELINRDLVDYQGIKHKANITTVNELA